MKYLTLFGITAMIFFALDMLWLGGIARNFYREKLSFVFSGQVRWPAALLFYCIYILGILYFVVVPGFEHPNWKSVFLNGALLGLLCYATYDLTNLATIMQWPWQIVVVDMLWGSLLTGLVSLFSFLAATRLLHF